jgi:xanthine dehydrogenase accessory factor
MRWDVERRAQDLRRAGRPFVLATVVQVERPASTHPGDRAVVTPDGVLEGWIGGACAEPVVIREALRALAEGTARLVRVGPPESAAAPGVIAAVTTCPSGGTVEVFLEPVRPDPHLVVFGESLVARTLAQLAQVLGYRVTAVVSQAGHAMRADAVYVGHLPPDAVGPDDGVVVATMGHWDEDAASDALRTPAAYVALVASRRRAAAVREALRQRGVDETSVARLRSPAGLDLGPATQEEIALAVLAEFVSARPRQPASRVPAVPQEAVDPVCGMAVAVLGARHTAEHQGRLYYFCSPSCQRRFLADPQAYAAVSP